MPVITQQIFKVSPMLYRIFRPSKAGRWGLALPSFEDSSIRGSKIRFDTGKAEMPTPAKQ